MKEKQGLLAQLMEVRRLMVCTGMNLQDALGLLVDQLRYYAERERWEEEKKHMEYPVWLYGQGI